MVGYKVTNQIDSMKKIILSVAALFAFSSLGALADELEGLAGKWVAERSEAQGRNYKQELEIKKNKFTFKATGEGGQGALYAEGEVKTEQLGPFKAAKFFNIQGGKSAADLESVDDERTVIYVLGNNELTVALNFDKERDQPPMATRYTKTAAAEEAQTLVIDKIVMHKTPQAAEYYLCLDATVGETTKRFHVENKTYEKDGLTVATDLAIPNVRKDQTCKFVLKLDDVAGDECTEEMDNRSAGSFTTTESGSQEFKPEDGWRYTIYWHLK
jgi:hypothetical protein